MTRLHIFNPESDYALASDSEYYTPPAHVLTLARENALLPAIFAAPGDWILIPDCLDFTELSCEMAEIAKSKNILLVHAEDLGRLENVPEQLTATPWGWNKAIRRRLLELPLASECRLKDYLPTTEKLDDLRGLSHRRTTIQFLKSMIDILDQEISLPEEIGDVEEAVDAFIKNRERYFKAPWSSSGRGILLTDDLEEHHIRPWIRGIIRRQGSVVMEKAYKRKLDFATEWYCSEDNGIKFLGYSVFNVSRRGKYHGNVRANQRELQRYITDASVSPLDQILEKQYDALRTLLGDRYNGPLGIDMLVTESGHINPCVELNLRHTMGMAGLLDYSTI